jgi:predicted ArsR family transcriptional regulator
MPPVNISSTFLENTFSLIRSTADRLLILLKTRGPQTAAELGVALAVSDETARQHLVKLAGEGLVEGASETRGWAGPSRFGI